MKNDVVEALDQFIQNFILLAQQDSNSLAVEYDPTWPSECYQESGSAGDWVKWCPKLRNDQADFSGFEKAMELTIHPDLKAFYARYWSDNLNAKAKNGSLQLLQAWNLQDFERLQQNLIGHILMKRRLRQPETLFFGVTDQEDFILTLDNSTGQVLLEQVGLQSNDILAPNLAQFIDLLEPEMISH